jgi:acyl-CoA dehydrogenase
MNFEHSDRAKMWQERVQRFVDDHIAPNDARFHADLRKGDPWSLSPIVEELKPRAREAGLWNLFMPPSHGAAHVDSHFKFEGPALSNMEYAPLAEIMGRYVWAAEVFNCSAPDTGNMEVLERYGTLEQKERWLRPLMDGAMRSTFCMTEPAVASSDARNVEMRIERDGTDYVINGRKWWSSGVGHPNCHLLIVMGKTDPEETGYRQQSMILVPRDTTGVIVERMLPVFGYDHAQHGGHGQLLFDNVRVPAENMLLGEGCGFEIAQGRLGPGRIHHAMRTIGAAEAALEKMCRRLLTRTAFGRTIAQYSVWEERIAEARTDLEMARLLCLKAADMMDRAGNKVARAEIAMIKVAAPRIAIRVIDDAIQAFGAAGVCDDFGLAEIYANNRILRIADGPDEVHNRTIARMELDKYRGAESPAVQPKLGSAA